MKKSLYTLLILLMFSFSAFAWFALVNWKVKENQYAVTFSGKRVSGSFGGLKASIQFDEAHPELSKISATIDATSISTGFFLKTTHAKSEEALDTDKYPTIEFVSAEVLKIGNAYQAKGKLTLKGITKPAIIQFTFDGKGLFKGNFTVNPKDFNITRSGVPDVIRIDLDIPVARP